MFDFDELDELLEKTENNSQERYSHIDANESSTDGSTRTSVNAKGDSSFADSGNDNNDGFSIGRGSKQQQSWTGLDSKEKRGPEPDLCKSQVAPPQQNQNLQHKQQQQQHQQQRHTHSSCTNTNNRGSSSSSGTRAFLKPQLVQAFAEALDLKWCAVDASPGHTVRYVIEWRLLSNPYENGKLDCRSSLRASLRGLASNADLSVRLAVKISSDDTPFGMTRQEQHLVGCWGYGAKSLEYCIEKSPQGELQFSGPHASTGIVTGDLKLNDHWFQAELSSDTGRVVGHIRLFFDEAEDVIISNFKGLSKTEWGKDLVAKKKTVSDDLVSSFSGDWCRFRTSAAIGEEEEDELCLDPFGNYRGNCLKCSCRLFAMPEQLGLKTPLGGILCQRCGCPVTSHVITGPSKSDQSDRSMWEGRVSGVANPSIPSTEWNSDSAPSGANALEYVMKQIKQARHKYEILGVAVTATALEIRQAFRTISLRLHPDKISSQVAASPQLQLQAEEAFQLITSAYEVLGDADARKSYDQQLRKDFGGARKGPRKESSQATQGQRTAESTTRTMEGDAEADQGGYAAHPGDFCHDFFNAPSIGTFLNSPFYGAGSVFGQCGVVKENMGGAFSFIVPGGGGIHVGSGEAYAQRSLLEEEMAKTGHIPPHLWAAAGLLPTPPAVGGGTMPSSWSGAAHRWNQTEKKDQA